MHYRVRINGIFLLDVLIGSNRASSAAHVPEHDSSQPVPMTCKMYPSIPCYLSIHRVSDSFGVEQGLRMNPSHRPLVREGGEQQGPPVSFTNTAADPVKAEYGVAKSYL